MSINELHDDESKPWMSLRCQDLNVTGNIRGTNVLPGAVLTYEGDNKALFVPPSTTHSFEPDRYTLQPTTLTGSASLTVLSDGVDTNFSILGGNIVCNNTGNYFVSIKLALEGTGSYPTSTLLTLQLFINGIPVQDSFINFPYQSTSSSNFVSMSLTSTNIVNILNTDILTLSYAVVPGANSYDMSTGPSASTISLILIN